MDVKKALLLTILPVTLIGSAIMLNANAEENNTTSVEGSYEVSVPANVSFDSSTKTNTMTVSGSVSKLHELNIGITSENGFKLKQNDNSIDYTLKDGDTVIKSGDSYAFPEGKDLSKYEQDSTFSKTFTLSTDGGSYAGDYTDKLIFTLTDKQCYHLGINPKDTSLTGEDIAYDVYVNGTLATQGSWAFSKNIPKGSTYEVKNITVKNDKYVYDSSEGDLSGTISKDTYVNLILAPTTNTVTFDLNGEGATCDTTSKKVAKNHVYGTLPTPIREGYIFDGWYTDATDGSVVTQDSIFNEDSDATLYAHWTEYSYKMIKGSDLCNKIKSKATSVVFTDTKAPENTSVQDLSSIGDGSVVGWWEGTTYKISTQVSSKKVIFNEDCSAMFFQCSKLSSIDFTNVDTSQVTSMEGMFVYSSMTSLDVSNFDTSNVTEMSLMFAGTNITTLDLSNFDTSKVTTMAGMFEDCKQLTSLNVTSFNTSAVTSMSEMFETCTLLTSLDLSSFDTTNVSNVTSMFKKDSNLEKIYVGENFVLDAAEDDSRFPMFLGCSKLPNYNSENPVENKSMAKSVSDGGYLYVNARTVTFDANGGDFEDGSVTSKIVEKGQTYGVLPTVTKEDAKFIGWYTDSTDGDVVTQDSTFNSDSDITLYAHWKESSYKLQTSLNANIPKNATSVVFTDIQVPENTTAEDLSADGDGSVVGWLSNTTYYVSTQVEGKKVILNEHSESTFTNCSQLVSIDFANVDTSKVTNMNAMFFGCSGITTLDLSDFDTSKVTDMGLMFRETSLTSLDLTSFDTSKVKNMTYMFYQCSNLKTLDLTSFDTSGLSSDLSDASTSDLVGVSGMFEGDANLENIYVSDKFELDSDVTESESAKMFEGCVKLPNYNLENPVVDKSMAISVSKGGYLYVNPITITFDANGGEFAEGSETSKVVEYSQKIGALPTVTKEGYTFAGWYLQGYSIGERVTEDTKCYYKNEITLLANWGTTNQLVAGSDFNDAIPVLDNDGGTKAITGVVFTDATAPSGAELTDLSAVGDNSVVGWLVDTTWYVSTQKEGQKIVFNEDSSGMFFTAAIVGKHEFNSIIFDNIDTSQVKNMSSMFGYCESLQSLSLPDDFVTSKVTDLSMMFAYCRNLTNIDVSKFDTSSVNNMYGMFVGCNKLTNLNLSSFNTSSVTDMTGMFYECTSLTSLDLSSFNTSNVTNMIYMFEDCTNLQTLDLSSFDTSKVTDFTEMFNGCSSLTKVYVKSQEDFEKIKAGANPDTTISFYLKGSDTPLTSESSSTESEDDSEENTASIAPTSEETNDVSQNNTSESTETNDSKDESTESETESTNETEVTVEEKEDVKTTDSSEEVVN